MKASLEVLFAYLLVYMPLLVLAVSGQGVWLFIYGVTVTAAHFFGLLFRQIYQDVKSYRLNKAKTKRKEKGKRSC